MSMSKTFNVPDVSFNQRPVRLSGFSAVQYLIYSLLTTRIGSLPDNPLAGFTIEDFLFISSDSEVFDGLKNELTKKISEIVGPDLVVNISKPKNEMIDIDITYTENGEVKKVSVSGGYENGVFVPHFRDISLR